jgi:uncharacterized protein YgbK (DUF1537 family)
MRAGLQADDLTGACDAGARFAARGLATVVLLAPGAGGGAAPPADVVVLDTESRGAAPADAARRARAATAGLAAARPAWVFKKVDSTLRGPLAAELGGALAGSGAALALLAPAFPAQARTVVDGAVRVAGRDAAETPVARDPAFPPTGASALAALGWAGPHPVAAVPLVTVRHPPALAARLDRALATGHRGLVADAETDEDLAALVAAAEGRPLLLAGSAGLAGALAARLAPAPPPGARPRLPGPLLVVAGSAHPATRAQLERLRARLGGEPAAAAAIAIEAAPPPGADPAPAAQTVAGALAARVRERVVGRGRPGTLLLTGGDTAAAVCRALGATTVRLTGELEPGLAAGVLQDGAAAGVTVVTKAGGFGDPDALVRTWEACR